MTQVDKRNLKEIITAIGNRIKGRIIIHKDSLFSDFNQIIINVTPIRRQIIPLQKISNSQRKLKNNLIHNNSMHHMGNNTITTNKHKPGRKKQQDLNRNMGGCRTDW